MGQEINAARFNQRDFDAFHTRLREETQLLRQYFEEQRFANDTTVCGFELEVWLVDQDGWPAPINAQFIETMASPMVTPELASFNLEFNYTPQALTGPALETLHREMQQLWDDGNRTATALNTQLVMIGILPTVRNEDLTMRHISGMKRYQALNEQVLRLREGRPLELNIYGQEKLRSSHMDVMMESATTSFQIHMQVPLDQAARIYNASQVVSAPMVAVSANAPFMFGKSLWAETRIPVFEQSVELGGYESGAHGPMRRVTFGSGYVRESLYEVFTENLEHYPILLPMLLDDEPAHFAHLRLHNGTLWRWNRPLIGVENGQLHVRIEHRVVPAGPSIIDAMANAAFYYGLAQFLGTRPTAPESQLPFELARDNFYHAAQHGLEAHITWLDGRKQKMQHLILDKLLPMAQRGLEQLQIDQADIDRYLGIIETRTKNNCNGAAWQRAFVAKYGPDMQALVRAYLQHQNSGEPVHDWGL
jgi:gamma-glutamyl:cysteine ligase YbdK (ATP-grasp superfamily)